MRVRNSQLCPSCGVYGGSGQLSYLWKRSLVTTCVRKVPCCGVFANSKEHRFFRSGAFELLYESYLKLSSCVTLHAV